MSREERGTAKAMKGSDPGRRYPGVTGRETGTRWTTTGRKPGRSTSATGAAGPRPTRPARVPTGKTKGTGTDTRGRSRGGRGGRQYGIQRGRGDKP